MQKSVRPFEGDQPTSVERRKRGRAPGTREVSGTLLGHFRSIRLKPSPEDGMPACNFTCVAYCSFFVLLLSNRAEQAPFLRVFDALGSKIVFEINDDESRLDGFPLPILGSFTPPPSLCPTCANCQPRVLRPFGNAVQPVLRPYASPTFCNTHCQFNLCYGITYLSWGPLCLA